MPIYILRTRHGRSLTLKKEIKSFQGTIKESIMGLAASQVRLLGLTARKADCELGISINAMHKMSLTREMSELTREYNAKLQAKNIAYYANGKYNKINYQYLMGNGRVHFSDFLENVDNYKKDNSMVLTDYKGQVVLHNDYAEAIMSVLGSDVSYGGAFSKDKIPEIIAEFVQGLNAEDIKTVMDGGQLSYIHAASAYNTLTGNKGDPTTLDVSKVMGEYVQKAIDFYLPIFQAAANNGWTTEYNTEIATNPDYISDALVSGTFQLETVDEYGDFKEGSSLTYFITNGALETNTSSETREEITAWYDAEKSRISEKETWLDIENKDLSTELEAINTEIQSVQSLIDDAISSVFDWGNA